MADTLVANKNNTKKGRSLKEKELTKIKVSIEKVVTVDESEKKTESQFDDSNDSDFDSLFESVSEDDDIDSNIERSVVVNKAKAKGRVTISPKKGKSKGVLIKKLVPTSTNKRKKDEKSSTEGPGPSSKSAKTPGAPRVSAK